MGIYYHKKSNMALLTINEDNEARIKALDVKHSFIVRSPAGSGKTQLLTLRFLALLCNVHNDPEEVLAITFTRKAAAEMRERILQALLTAENPIENSDPLFLQTKQLAKRVLARDSQENWHLLANPNRLRIQTIDSFCAYLTKQMPISAHFSAYSPIIEDPSFLYRQAARETLNEIDCEEAWSVAIEHLLLHFDNAHERIEKLLAAMLARRDQWIHYIRQGSRLYLEAGLAQIVHEHLTRLAAQFPPHHHAEMMALLHYAASQLNIDHPLNSVAERDQFPTDAVEDYPIWLAMAELLLTKEGQWRKTVTQQQGFPAQGNPVAKAMKAKALSLLSALSENESLRELLKEVVFLPPLHYSEQQWLAVTAWLKIFPLLLAHLQVLFQREGVVDYVEVSLNALAALGETEAPSDLTLLLDQQIQHILIDEFQDTSFSQWRLLEKMTAGWQPGDGRTLFLVGDPMQSIYRFRKAEVGLFLKAAAQGMSSMSLELLTLQMNFRSEANLVHWVSKTFADLMPLDEDLRSGAIKFIASIPTKYAQNDPVAVKWYPLFNADNARQATQIIAIVHAIFANDPQAKMAILVKARSHAQSILPLLRAAHIAYQAVELDQLESSPVILDLLALTRAFLNPADRIAWLAILRAPWCGLLLTDLYQIAGIETEKVIWERIVDVPALGLSQESEMRLAYFVSVMKQNLNQRGSLPLRATIEKIWRELRGHICLSDHNEEQNSKVFFEVLDKLEVAGDILDVAELEQRLSSRYTTSVFIPTENSPTIEIMTMHKAKGLEFDHVILPYLEKKTAQDDAQLLLWSEYVGLNQENYLILGPIKDTESKIDPIYRYLQRQESEKARHEMLRLFYVAVTRAKQSLHLIGSVNCQVEGIKKPATQSFLGQVWSSAEIIFTQALSEKLIDQDVVEVTAEQTNHQLRRLKTSFFTLPYCSPVRPSLRPRVRHCERSEAKRGRYGNPGNKSNISGLLHPANAGFAMTASRGDEQLPKKQHFAQSVGTVIHQNLQYLNINVVDPVKYFEPAASRQALLELGVSLVDIDKAVSVVERAIKNVLVCERGRWIFNPQHQDIHSEYPLSYLEQNRLVSCVIDRTFIDSHGVRWIIDFKTSITPIEKLDVFLHDEKKMHQAQLEHYARLVRKLDDRPIRLGLYFPLQSAWIEWEAN